MIGEGAKSIGTTIIAATVPYQPDPVTRLDASASFIQPQWIAPQDGGTPIRGYRVYKNGIKVSEVDWNVYDYVITSNLVAGNTYQISVSAFNDVGESILS